MENQRKKETEIEKETLSTKAVGSIFGFMMGVILLILLLNIPY